MEKLHSDKVTQKKKNSLSLVIERRQRALYIQSLSEKTLPKPWHMEKEKIGSSYYRVEAWTEKRA